MLNREGIPAGPILTIEEMFKHPQTAAREMLLQLAHPAIGTFQTTGLAAKLSETPGHITRPPLLGEHTEEVLHSSGFTSEEVAKLREAKAIQVMPASAARCRRAAPFEDLGGSDFGDGRVRLR